MVVVKILLHSEKEKKTRQKHFKRTHLIIIIIYMDTTYDYW